MTEFNDDSGPASADSGLPATQLPLNVLEALGDLPETTILAAYVRAKAAVALKHGKHKPQEAESLEYLARVLEETATEIENGFHLKELRIEGRVIPYNEAQTDGPFHAEAISILVADIHGRNVKAGWWTDLNTGEPLVRNVGELLMLMVSELAEAMEGHRKNLMDDKLPHRSMIEVELADCIIRIADAAGGLGLDLGGAIDEKLAYNANRADHKPENRVKANGKKY